MSWLEICGKALLLCVAFAIGFFVRRVYCHPLSAFPGPKLVAASSFQHFYAVWTGREKNWYKDLHRKYGPIVRCGPNHITFNDLDLIPVVYHRQSDKTDYPQDFTCPGAATNKANYLEYAAAKRRFGQAFSVSRVQIFEGLVDENLAKLLSVLNEETKTTTSIDWGIWARYLAFDVYVPMSLGESFGFLDHKGDARNILPSTFRIFRYWTLSRYRPIAWLATNTWLGRRLFVSGREDSKGMGIWTDEVHKIAQQRIASAGEERKAHMEHSMLDQWLAIKSPAGEGIPLTDIEDQLVSDVLGGPYAIATVLGYLINIMAKHPAAVKRAQQEIDEAFAQQTSPGPSLTYTECCALPFVDACIREIMRITATASPRWRTSPDRPLRIGDREVPPGTAVATSPFTVSTHPQLYGDNSEEFNPARWVEATEEQLKVWNSYDAHWGFGYRKCPGRYIGVLVLYKTFVTILRHFDVKDGTPGSSSLLMEPRKL